MLSWRREKRTLKNNFDANDSEVAVVKRWMRKGPDAYKHLADMIDAYTAR